MSNDDDDDDDTTTDVDDDDDDDNDDDDISFVILAFNEILTMSMNKGEVEMNKLLTKR